MSSYNLILDADSYKASHYLQYPPKTTHVSSYIESRGGADQLVFFGLQMFLYKYFSKQITEDHIDKAEHVLKRHGVPFNKKGWEYIVKEKSGILPLRIDAVKEGSVIPPGNILVQVINTDPNCFWLTSYVETALLRAVWYPTTVCTLSYLCKQIISTYLEKTSDDPESELLFKLHDFGFRGVSSHESGEIGGLAHLVNFRGTDTLAAIVAANDYYDEEMAAFSIPASEHSTITSWEKDGEIDAFKNMIEQFGGENKIYACVSDSYDIYDAVENKWPSLEKLILKKGGRVVIRPDSGNPVEVVQNVIQKLMSKFGYSTNTKGYAVLPPYIRVIQGDGINIESLESILANLEKCNISASNIAFGMGGGLLQKVDRDTLRFAMKCSAVCVDGKWKDVYKDPITGPSKKSKRGRLALIQDNNGAYKTIREDALNGHQNLLECVYDSGVFQRHQTLSEIRQRTNSNVIKRQTSD
jgi:nicotinamide phosphoribosyltransferase